MEHRAYTRLELKMVDEDKRILEGIATTPTTDRMGDIVEPGGAKFTLPLPLLWQHDAHAPVGEVFAAKASKNGIKIRASIAKVDEPGPLKDRLDEAWQSVKANLIKGLSIGFKSLEKELIGEDDSGFFPQSTYRFLSWDWMELSLVTIPANAEATITAIKQADQVGLKRSAASGASSVSVTTKVATSLPGATGPKPTRSNGMKTIAEQITQWEAKRQASAAQLGEIMEVAGKDNLSLDAEQKEKFDTLESEIKECDEHMKRLRIAADLNIAIAAPVKPEAGTDPAKAASARVPAKEGLRVKSNLEPGVKFARFAMAMHRGKGNLHAAAAIYENDSRWMDTAPEVLTVLKAAINAGDTTTANWASELVYNQNIAGEFIEFLRPLTIIGRVTGWRAVPFNVRVASATQGSTGYWVGQGRGINASQMATSSVSLGTAKVAGMVVIDNELARSSSPSAELLVRNDLAQELQQTLDLSLIDPNQGGLTNIQPASLTYGVTPVTPTGTNYAAFVADWKSLTSTMLAANVSVGGSALVMSETTAQALSMMVTSLGNPQFPGLTMTGGTLQGLPVVTTQAANIAGSPQFAEMIVLIKASEVFLADDGQATVSVSDVASIQMDDATTQQSTATATATSVVSMFQTESMAVKAVRYINWTKARTQAVAFIQNALYA